jgi:HAD superfamily hydrolase (TIGR01509 family)
MNVEAVLFDCDGVIVDSEAVGVAHFIRELEALGLGMSHAQVVELFVGKTLPGAARTLRAAGHPIPEDWHRGVYDRLYDTLAEGTPLIRGVEMALDALDAAGVRYAVGSNGEMRKMETTLPQHPRVWRRVKDHLYSAQALGAPKPDPAIYLHAAAALGVAPGACVVIDDSPSGCEAGVAGGFRTLGFATGLHGAEELEAVGAEVFTDMGALPGLIGIAP